MKYLIVGLGNIGNEYANTRHNIGFDVIDELAKAKSCSFEIEKLAIKTSFKHKGRTFILIKPTTYMNLSGKALKYWMEKEKVAIENVLVLVDDLNLDFGKVRLRAKGSAGGHNGLKHINEVLGHQDYARLRIGIGDAFSKGRQVDFVLGKWDKGEQEGMPNLLDHCAKASISFGMAGMSITMNQFNIK